MSNIRNIQSEIIKFDENALYGFNGLGINMPFYSIFAGATETYDKSLVKQTKKSIEMDAVKWEKLLLDTNEFRPVSWKQGKSFSFDPYALTVAISINKVYKGDVATATNSLKAGIAKDGGLFVEKTIQDHILSEGSQNSTTGEIAEGTEATDYLNIFSSMTAKMAERFQKQGVMPDIACVISGVKTIPNILYKVYTVANTVDSVVNLVRSKIKANIAFLVVPNSNSAEESITFVPLRSPTLVKLHSAGLPYEIGTDVGVVADVTHFSIGNHAIENREKLIQKTTITYA